VALYEFDGIGTGFHARAGTISEAAKFVGKRSSPFGAGLGVLAEMAVLHGIDGVRVSDGKGEMFR
jgi:hypothetical protein